MRDLFTKPIDGGIVLADALATLRSLDAGSVAAVVTDPPYGIGYHSNRHEGRNPHAPISGDWNFQIGPFLAEVGRVLHEGGALYLFSRFDVYPLWAPAIAHPLVLKNVIVWDKGTHTSGDLTGNFGFQYEVILLIVKGRHQLRGYRFSNIWPIPKISPARLRVPAEKPVELYRRAILSSTDKGDLVVDVFGGSGTLAEAAIDTERRFLVCDIDKAMVRMARERIGLSPLDFDDTPITVPICPVFESRPASPALWGVHPEDIADWKSLRNEPQQASILTL